MSARKTNYVGKQTELTESQNRADIERTDERAGKGIKKTLVLADRPYRIPV